MKKIYSWKEGHLNWTPLAIMNKLPKLFERNLDENGHTIAGLNQLLSYVWFPSLYGSLSRNMFADICFLLCIYSSLPVLDWPFCFPLDDSSLSDSCPQFAVPQALSRLHSSLATALWTLIGS